MVNLDMLACERLLTYVALKEDIRALTGCAFLSSKKDFDTLSFKNDLEVRVIPPRSPKRAPYLCT